MGRLAVILGSSALGPGGRADRGGGGRARGGDRAAPRRRAGYVLPHQIDHAANLRALVEQGCDRVLAISSVGSLKPSCRSAPLVCPDDFIALGVGPTIFDGRARPQRAGLRPAWRAEVVEAWAAGGRAARDGGVYWQTMRAALRDPGRDPADRPPRRRGRDDDRLRVRRSPRELELPYAALCVVDNVANGLGEAELELVELEATASATPRSCTTGWRRCCRGWGRSAGDRAVPFARNASERNHAMAVDGDERLARRREGGRALRGGLIAAIGPEVAARPGEETIDAGGALLVPPLLNGHTHAAMTLFRGTGGDLPLMPWLEERIWPVEAKLEDEDVYWGARLACAEMIRTGTARFWDMYWQAGATARAVADAGLRATVGGAAVRLRGRRHRAGPRSATVLRASTAGRFEPATASTPRSPRTRSTPSASDRCAGSPSSPPSAASPIQIHLSETSEEVEDCIAAPRRCDRPPTSTASGCSASARRSPTASGSTGPSWS